MSLTIIMGPMFAGKSTMLINKINTLLADENIGENNIYLVNHTSDNRYCEQGGFSIVSHDGYSVKSHGCNNLGEILPNLEGNSITHIIIDEAHFYEDLFDVVVKLLSQGKNIIVAGLSGDYMLKPFTKSRFLELIPYCTEIVKLSARCEICDKSAHYTKMITSNTPTDQIKVGGKETFIPVCPEHYFSN